MNRAGANDREPVEYFEGLEATADNLTRLLGEAGVKLLAEHFGGVRIYIPARPGAHHPLTVALGQIGADRLAGAFHGLEIEVPMMAETRAEICRLDALGWTRRAIAREVRCTERWVYKVLEDSPSIPSRQGRLFG